MVRNFVAFGLLALAGMLILPEPAEAAAGGIRGGVRGHFRAPVAFHRHPRAGILRTGRTIPRPHAHPLPLPAKPKFHLGPVRTTLAAPWSRLHRRHHHHHRHLTGWIHPITVDSGAAYFGMPYGPAETIPVYAPLPAEDTADPVPPRMAPRLTNAREENQDACRAERVTVPAAEGEREITVIRC